MEPDVAPPQYWITRFLILRLLGLVYLVAFLAAAWQNGALIGSHGLSPVPVYLQSLQDRGIGNSEVPTLFWFGYSDGLLEGLAWTGAALSALVLLGLANSFIMAALWVLYMSIVHVGQDFYAFGWEMQLLETGFLAIFLCPLLDPRPFPASSPPTQVIWLLRWLGFRIMLGAGLIKLRGDSCWRDLTCLDYHFETQPVPNPFSWYLHFLPRPLLHFGVLCNHFCELIAPWSCFGPRRIRYAGAFAMIGFQVFLIGSGNLSFLNWLTIVPLLAYLDDSLLSRLIPPLGRRALAAQTEGRQAPGQSAACWGLTLVIGYLSLGPIGNLLSSRQAMNTSFDPLDLVNTYGAFGSIGRERDEIILEGTLDADPATARWKEYSFKVKPGDPTARPAFISPYHYRLDWLMWFAAMTTPANYPWTYHLVWKLLHNDPATLALMGANPFPDQPPRFIRAQLYRYHFAPPGEGRWWDRTLLGSWIGPVSADNPDFQDLLRANRWLPSGEGSSAARGNLSQ